LIKDREPLIENIIGFVDDLAILVLSPKLISFLTIIVGMSRNDFTELKRFWATTK
jgi:hypothetical protein